RRRHTRFSRDWSSDVCSSDLVYPNPATETLTIESSHNPDTMEKSTQKPDQRYTLYDFNGTIVQRGWLNNKTTLDVTKLKKGRYRSEERRVGKRYRSR